MVSELQIHTKSLSYNLTFVLHNSSADDILAYVRGAHSFQLRRMVAHAVQRRPRFVLTNGDRDP